MSEWISVVSRVPESKTDVLVHTGCGDMSVAFYNPSTGLWKAMSDGGIVEDYDHSDRILHPLHWMPLPESP